MPRKSQAENSKNNRKTQKDPHFPNGYAKIDHKSFNIREILASCPNKAKPEWMAVLHHDLELNAGTLSERSINYFVTCWGWGHRRVKTFLKKRRTLAEVVQNSCRGSAEGDPAKTLGSEQSVQNSCRESDEVVQSSCRQYKEKEKEKEQREDKSSLRAHAREEVFTIQIPEWLPMEIWLEFIDHRKDIKTPLTERATKMALAELEKLRNQGNDPTEVIQQTILNGWKGLFAVKNNRHSSSGFKSKAERAYDANMKRLQELGDSEVPF